MQQMIPVNSKVLNDILSTLGEVKKDVKRLSQRIKSLEPIYGSGAWWEKETKEALEEHKKGLGKTVGNVRELHALFNDLESQNEAKVSA